MRYACNERIASAKRSIELRARQSKRALWLEHILRSGVSFFDRSLLLLLLFGEQSRTERLRAQMLWHISAENLICAVSTDKWQNVCDSKVFHSRIIFLSLSLFHFFLFIIISFVFHTIVSLSGMIRILYLRIASTAATPKYNGIHFHEQYNNSCVSASHAKPSIARCMNRHGNVQCKRTERMQQSCWQQRE